MWLMLVWPTWECEVNNMTDLSEKKVKRECLLKRSDLRQAVSHQSIQQLVWIFPFHCELPKRWKVDHAHSFHHQFTLTPHRSKPVSPSETGSDKEIMNQVRGVLKGLCYRSDVWRSSLHNQNKKHSTHCTKRNHSVSESVGLIVTKSPADLLSFTHY